MAYSVIKENEVFKILEKDTNIIVQKYKDEKEARALCRMLNLGSGFNGWTPPFFALEYPDHTNENAAQN